MAFFAIGQQMPAGQREARHPMIELGFLPRLFMMASFAFLALLPFVLVVFFVARVAIGLQLVLIQIAFVASHAFRFYVLAQQRVFGLLVMIEHDLFPAAIDVAGLAQRSKGLLVFVVLQVTGQTIHLELVLIQVSGMASHTLHGRTMFPRQREFGFLVVIERNLFPAALDVAAFALRSETALVLVVFLVTRQTIHLQLVFIQIAFVAADAFHFMVFSQQRIFGLFVMIENDLFPALDVMASLALRPEGTLVLVVFFVTGVAFFWRVFIFVVDMAFGALDVDMLVDQREMRFAVIEVSGLPVLLLMTIRALRSQRTFMFIVLLMTGIAGGWRFAEFLFRGMTVLAQDFFFQVSALQQKTGGGMVEFGGIKFGDFRIAAFVLGMASIAFLLFFHQAVQAVLVGDILLDVFMTIFA